MDNPSPHALEIGQPKPKIAFLNGRWWYLDPGRENTVHLDPLLWKVQWRVERLCELLSINRRTFARIVHASLGKTAKVWLRELRIVAASHLLREGYKISALSKQLGIGNETDFSREFKKLFGVTPSFFRHSELSRTGELEHISQEPRSNRRITE